MEQFRSVPYGAVWLPVRSPLLWQANEMETVRFSRGTKRGHGQTMTEFALVVPILLVLSLAGSMAGRRVAPPGLGTLRTDSPTFVVYLIAFVAIVAVLTFLTVLALGPLAQGLGTHLIDEAAAGC